RPGTTRATKLPCLSVVACLIVFAPSRTSDTSAPASGLPWLSRTVPVMVASDLYEPVASASLVMNDTSAIRDNPKPSALLMRRPPQPKSLWKPWTDQLVQARRLYRNRQKQPPIFCHGRNNCQVNGRKNGWFAPRLPTLLGRARIPNPLL